MSSLATLDIGVGGIAGGAASVFGNIAMNGDEYVRCLVCGYGGCDVRVSGCGCTVHARCVPIKPDEGSLSSCPLCSKQTTGLNLFPMSFREIDEARKTANSLPAGGRGRGRKRKSESGSSTFDDKGHYVSDRRTGRWTTEETVYCDKLIEKFETGELPIVNGIKLNEFLGNMLKSKQSRLTKKMKNAKLSTKTFHRGVGYLANSNEAREFSELEDAFFHGIQDPQERAEIKFHMQREWREQFSQYCVSIGQPLDADSWLSSVEEMDRRASQAQNAARMSRRKLMVGMALRTDAMNPDHGVFIEKTESEHIVAERSMGDSGNEDSVMLGLLSEQRDALANEMNGKSRLLHSAPFLAKTLSYIERHNVPFEHIDLWVPSFVPSNTGNAEAATNESCRLCYAGSGTLDKQVGEDGKASRALTAEEQFNLHAFGDYSQKFSFDVGCGLPGRVYESGRPTWEQSVQNAPHHHFERCGGAIQWGIKTVLGFPISSPNVGRIVVTLYSHHDRSRDQDLVMRLMEEFGRLMPYPKWKLVVDIGEPEAPLKTSTGTVSQNSYDPVDAVVSSSASNSIASGVGVSAVASGGKDPRIDEVVSLLGEFMPSDPTSAMSPYLSGFMSLRLLLLRPTRSVEEEELAGTMMESYSSYSAGGRSRSDIAIMLARDYMFLSQQQQQVQQQQQQQQSFLRLDQAHSHPMVHTGSMQGNVTMFGAPSQPTGQPTPTVPGGMDSMSIVSN